VQIHPNPTLKPAFLVKNFLANTTFRGAIQSFEEEKSKKQSPDPDPTWSQMNHLIQNTVCSATLRIHPNPYLKHVFLVTNFLETLALVLEAQFKVLQKNQRSKVQIRILLGLK
jgi:hypothetical protein